MVRCGRQANIVLHTVLHTVLYRVTHHVLSARIGWLVCERFSLRDTDSRPCVAIAVSRRFRLASNSVLDALSECLDVVE